MPRPVLPANKRKQKMLVTVDKGIYNYLKSKRIRISPFINHLLKVAISGNIADLQEHRQKSGYRTHPQR